MADSKVQFSGTQAGQPVSQESKTPEATTDEVPQFVTKAEMQEYENRVFARAQGYVDKRFTTAKPDQSTPAPSESTKAREGIKTQAQILRSVVQSRT